MHALPFAFNPFYVGGAAFAAWGFLLGVVAFMSADFPRNQGAQRLVMLVSVVLMMTAVGTAIYGAIHEEDNTKSHNGEGPVPASDKPPRK